MQEERVQILERVPSGNNGVRDGHGATRYPVAQSELSSDFAMKAQSVFEPILDTEEAAALLKIHPKTLQKLARSGRIPGFRIGKLWGFRASALNRWLEKTASP